MMSHVPVMLGQVLRWLAPIPGARVVDGTLGLGGHAEAILEGILPGGLLIGLDRDPEMLERARGRLARFGDSVRLFRSRLSHLREAVEGAGLGPVDGVLMDLGICSAQLDDPSRGLAFREQSGRASLDMRLDRSRGETAAELLERVDESELADILRRGDVPGPRRVARTLLERRPIRTADELVEALRGARLPRRRHHPATLVFQALRIAVNDELREIDAGLEGALEVLAAGRPRLPLGRGPARQGVPAARGAGLHLSARASAVRLWSDAPVEDSLPRPGTRAGRGDVQSARA
jgi:16S rRNA (cytosine1402-N4)-methyltransferase